MEIILYQNLWVIESRQTHLFLFKNPVIILLIIFKRVTSTQVHVDKSLQFVPLQLAAPNQATAEKNQGSINLYIEERYRLSCSSPLDETYLWYS